MNLPDLVLYEIFSNFTYEQKLNLKLSLVCKRWKQLMKNAEPKRLFVYEQEVSFNHDWAYQKVRYEEYIHFRFFLKCLIHNQLKDLKSLYLYKIKSFLPRYIKLEIFLSYLNELEELIVYSDYHYCTINNLSNHKELLSNLSNLKILSIKNTFSNPFSVNCLNLERLTFWNFIHEDFTLSSKIILPYPNRIKFIECQVFTEKCFQVNQFENLEHLVCQTISSNFKLSMHPKLRKVELSLLEKEFHMVKMIKTQRNQFKRFDLELFICGCKIDDYEYFFKDKMTLEENKKPLGIQSFRINDTISMLDKSYKLVKKLPWHVEIVFDKKVPDLSYFKHALKFKVRTIIIENFLDCKPLIKYLKFLNELDYMVISNCQLDAEFCDQLKEIPSIPELKLAYNKPESFNLDFLTKIKFLKIVRLESDSFSIDSIENIAKKREFFAFFLQNKILSIKFGFQEKKFWLSIGGGTDYYTHDLNEFSAFLRKNERVNFFFY